MTFSEWLVATIPTETLRPMLVGWAPEYLDDEALRVWLICCHDEHPVFVPLNMVYGDDYRHHLAGRRQPWDAYHKQVRSTMGESPERN